MCTFHLAYFKSACQFMRVRPLQGRTVICYVSSSLIFRSDVLGSYTSTSSDASIRFIDDDSAVFYDTAGMNTSKPEADLVETSAEIHPVPEDSGKKKSPEIGKKCHRSAKSILLRARGINLTKSSDYDSLVSR